MWVLWTATKSSANWLSKIIKIQQADLRTPLLLSLSPAAPKKNQTSKAQTLKRKKRPFLNRAMSPNSWRREIRQRSPPSRTATRPKGHPNLPCSQPPAKRRPLLPSAAKQVTRSARRVRSQPPTLPPIYWSRSTWTHQPVSQLLRGWSGIDPGIGLALEILRR